MATNTPNFDLKLVEGTDIVNPLIYDNPNYTKIDSQMFDNQNNGIPKANYAKSETTHKITRSIITANVFWFIASANFSAGDTFTVDGGVVTATLPDGSGLENGCFKINSNVICVLNGSILTVYADKQLAETAKKLATPVNIGSASFDGSKSITLAQMGAMSNSGAKFVNEEVNTGKLWEDESGNLYPIYRRKYNNISVPDIAGFKNTPLTGLTTEYVREMLGVVEPSYMVRVNGAHSSINMYNATNPQWAGNNSVHIVTIDSNQYEAQVIVGGEETGRRMVINVEYTKLSDRPVTT